LRRCEWELVSLLREVRQLSALGFSIRRDIATEVRRSKLNR
jgi:hypothetical protein